MMIAAIAFVVVILKLGRTARAQATGWADGQVNISLCSWLEPRAAIVQDTVYFDGGLLYWRKGMGDGTASVSGDGPAGGNLMRTIDLSAPFNIGQNLSSVFKSVAKSQGAGNNAPNYMDGALLANYHEFFLYGGLMAASPFAEPFAQEILGYRVDQYGPVKEEFTPGPVTVHLPDDMTRYVAYGAFASAPSENLAWYISGMTSPSKGPIYQPTLDNSTNAITVTDSVIRLDMTNQLREEWSNKTLPGNIRGRANAEAVWLPVGARGIVVLIGGSTDPEYAYPLRKSGDGLQSGLEESARFMSTIDVYDVSGDKWYQQDAESTPGTRTRACAVAVSADDFSSFNIYYYGGYNGVDRDKPFNNEVWVLSLPSFTWTQLPTTGGPGQGRAGHKCIQPFPSQMMVVGGEEASDPKAGLQCVDGFVQLLNLTDGKWLQSYDPVASGDYAVPVQVREAIGGDGSGGATMTAPKSGWQTPELGSVFSTPYPTSRITNWFPYENGDGPNRPSVQSKENGSNLPNWAAPVIGALSGLVFVAAGVFLILCLRRRRKRQTRSLERRESQEPRSRILSWIMDPKSSLAGSTANSPVTSGESAGRASIHKESPTIGSDIERQEMDNTGIAELMDTSGPVELEDTALTPFEIINKHSRFATGGTQTLVGTTPHLSASLGSDKNSRQALGKDQGVKSAPASLGVANRHRLSAGEVPGLSEGDPGHSRQMSDGAVTVSPAGTKREKEENEEGEEDERKQEEGLTEASGGQRLDAASQPAAADHGGGEGGGGGTTVSRSRASTTTRRGAFIENEEDLGATQ